MKKVICFARVSTLQQSLEAQHTAVKRAILADGYREEQIIYVQGKESAIKLEEEQRQTLNEMKELANNNDVDAIYFFAVDRLARRMSIVLNVVEWALSNGINMVFLNPHRMGIFRTNEHGEKIEDELTKLLLVMLSYGAEMEMKVKKARFDTAKKAMKAQGKLPQGKPIKGYYLGEDRTILVNESEASLIRNLFNDYLDSDNNESMNSLHDKYVVKGLFEPIESKYHSAGKMRVWNMFKDPSYCGRTKTIIKKVKGVVFKTNITYPPIISTELWDAVQEKLSSRKHAPKKVLSNVYYAKGLVKCGVCGGTLKTDTFNCTYTCKEKKGHTLSCNMNVIDNITWLSAKGWWNYYTMIDWSEAKAGYEERLSDLKVKIGITEKQIADLYAKIDWANERVFRGKMKEEQADKLIEGSNQEIIKLKNHLSQLHSSFDNYTEMLEELNQQTITKPKELDKLTDNERLDIIKKVISKIGIVRHENNKYLYDIHIIPTERIKPFANIDKMYWQYDSKHLKLYLVEFYEDGVVDGKCVTNEWISKDVSFHLEEKRHKTRQRTKKGNG